MTTTTRDQLFPRYRMTDKELQAARAADAEAQRKFEAYMASHPCTLDLFTEMFGDA